MAQPARASTANFQNRGPCMMARANQADHRTLEILSGQSAPGATQDLEHTASNYRIHHPDEALPVRQVHPISHARMLVERLANTIDKLPVREGFVAIAIVFPRVALGWADM